LSIIGKKLGLQQRESLSEDKVKKIRPVKWAMLGALVFGFPLLTGLGFMDESLGSPFCSICPSRIMTTLMTGDVSQLYVDTSSTGYMILSIIADFLFGLMLALGLTMRQPFCRICPMLALHAVFRKVGLVRLVKNAKPRCEKCGLCAKACPMDIKEIHTDMVNKDVLFPDCTLCGRCVEFCPDKDVLMMKYTVFPIFKADPAYFKQRKKAQTKWEKANLISWWKSRKAVAETSGDNS
jgi:formate hydrogenlyase subunit 6/NADH:ubiquinone oxidoreductase subunit I